MHVIKNEANMKSRKNQEGFATVIVIVFTAVLFLLFSLALEFNFQWHKNNLNIEKSLQKKADSLNKIKISNNNTGGEL